MSQRWMRGGGERATLESLTAAWPDLSEAPAPLPPVPDAQLTVRGLVDQVTAVAAHEGNSEVARLLADPASEAITHDLFWWVLGVLAEDVHDRDEAEQSQSQQSRSQCSRPFGPDRAGGEVLLSRIARQWCAILLAMPLRRRDSAVPAYALRLAACVYQCVARCLAPSPACNPRAVGLRRRVAHLVQRVLIGVPAREGVEGADGPSWRVTTYEEDAAAGVLRVITGDGEEALSGPDVPPALDGAGGAAPGSSALCPTVPLLRAPNPPHNTPDPRRPRSAIGRRPRSARPPPKSWKRVSWRRRQQADEPPPPLVMRQWPMMGDFEAHGKQRKSLSRSVRPTWTWSGKDTLLPETDAPPPPMTLSPTVKVASPRGSVPPVLSPDATTKRFDEIDENAFSFTMCFDSSCLEPRSPVSQAGGRVDPAVAEARAQAELQRGLSSALRELHEVTERGRDRARAVCQRTGLYAAAGCEPPASVEPQACSSPPKPPTGRRYWFACGSRVTPAPRGAVKRGRLWRERAAATPVGCDMLLPFGVSSSSPLVELWQTEHQRPATPRPTASRRPDHSVSWFLPAHGTGDGPRDGAFAEMGRACTARAAMHKREAANERAKAAAPPPSVAPAPEEKEGEAARRDSAALLRRFERQQQDAKVSLLRERAGRVTAVLKEAREADVARTAAGNFSGPASGTSGRTTAKEAQMRWESAIAGALRAVGDADKILGSATLYRRLAKGALAELLAARCAAAPILKSAQRDAARAERRAAMLASLEPAFDPQSTEAQFSDILSEDGDPGDALAGTTA